MAKDKSGQLMKVLSFVYRFPHNVSHEDLIDAVYGKDANSGYRKEKLDLIQRRGVTYWFCDLDLANQKLLAQMMIDRYGDHLERLLA